MFSSKTSEWGTPQKLYDMLDSIYGFTLDPCATAENSKCKEYFTKEEKREVLFGGIEKMYEKYRPLLYQAKVKEKPKKTIQANNVSSLKKLFTKKNKDSLTGNILRLKKLYNNGSLTKAEFEKAKNKLLK